MAESLRTIQACFQCNFKVLSMEFLTYEGFWGKTNNVAMYLRCIHKTNSRVIVAACVEILTVRCKESFLRVIKIILVGVREFKSALNTTSNLQVIHVIRDPRGILYSRMHVSRQRNVTAALIDLCPNMCQEMKADLEVSTVLSKRFPNRAKVLRYETLAMDPINKARQLYEFVGITPNFGDLAHVYCKAYSMKDKQEEFETSRKNSSRVAYAWLRRARRRDVRLVDELCHDVYKMAGYVSVDNDTYLSRRILYDEHFVI